MVFNKKQVNPEVPTPCMAPMKQVRDAWNVSCYNTIFLYFAHGWKKCKQDWKCQENLQKLYSLEMLNLFKKCSVLWNRCSENLMCMSALMHQFLHWCFWKRWVNYEIRIWEKQTVFNLRAKTLGFSKQGEASLNNGLNAHCDLRILGEPGQNEAQN